MSGINEWKRVPGYPNYVVSTDGRVRRTRRSGLKGIPSKFIKPKMQFGEPVFGLWKHNRRKYFSPQVLIALAYLKPFDDLSRLEVQRINPRKKVYYTNLRYVYKIGNPRRRWRENKIRLKTLNLRRYGDLNLQTVKTK